MPTQSSALTDEQRPLLEGHKVVGNGTIEPDAEQAIADDNGTPLPGDITTLEGLAMMGSVWFGTFLGALDSTIVATLATPIANSFDSFSLLSWVATGYLIANAAFQPISGKLTDIYGRKNGFLVANIFFCAGNLICALAQRDWVMILGRVVAGMGGGCLNTISTFIASDIIPLRRRGVWQGFGNICYGVGMSIGGVFGGWINDWLGWRWAFGVQVPLTIISGALAFFTIKIPVKKTDGSKIKRVDFLGAFTLVTALVLLLLGLNSGGNVVPWTHPLVLTTLPLSFLCLAGFVYIEAKVAPEPIIPMTQLAHRTVLSACFTNWFCSMAFFGIFFYAAIHFQVQGDSTTTAGTKLIPFSLGIAIGSVGSGVIMRAIGRYYWLNVIVMVFFIAAYGVASMLDKDMPLWPSMVAFLLIGLGQASMLTVTLTAFIAAVDHKYQAVITSASYAFRSTGSTIGITICSAVFQNILKDESWKRLGHREGAAEIIPKIRDSLDFVKKLGPEWKVPVLQIYTDALRGVFLTTLGMAALGALVSLLLKEHKLHKTLARRESA